MRYGQLLALLGLSTVLALGSSFNPEPASGQGGGTPSTPTTEDASCTVDIDNLSNLRSERVDLFYYRDASAIIELVNALLANDKGCASALLTPDAFSGARGVQRSVGNVILLNGDEHYIDQAKRLIVPLDLRLPGVDLQLWGVQISGGRPERLSEVMIDVREEISLTRQLVRDTFNLLHFEAQRTLAQIDLPGERNFQRPLPSLDDNDSDQDGGDDGFLTIAKKLGYEDVFASSRRLILQETFLVGKTVTDPEQFYRNLYSAVVDGEIKNGRFHAKDERFQPYFDAMIETGRPPLERVFRSRGLEPHCLAYNPDNDKKCEMWTWRAIVSQAEGGGVSSVEFISNTDRQTTLEFAFQFADFLINPNHFDPEELRRTADSINSELQQITNAFQRDIEDLFVRPTLNNIQNRVAQTRGVSFAQVGRTTVATLNGVETTVNTSAQSVFDNPRPRTLVEILDRASDLEPAVAGLSATERITGSDAEGIEAVPSTPITMAGPLPISDLVGVLTALTEADRGSINASTAGTRLTFTPGVLRDLNSAELDINLMVTNPSFTATQADESRQNQGFSRIGTQTINTTVYTQALDFFDLSTFASQATLDGGRAYFPVVGQLWRAIFGSIPYFGELFSFPREPQTVIHESLLLTNSFITPTALGVGLLFPTADPVIYEGNENFCRTQYTLLEYLATLNSQRISNPGSVNNPRLLSQLPRDRCKDFMPGQETVDEPGGASNG